MRAGAQLEHTDGNLVHKPEFAKLPPNTYLQPTFESFEFLVSKHRDRPYRGSRQKHWIKLKNRKHPAMDRVMEPFR
jgi:bifunctional non-homologous end joining protein LigD